MLTYTIIRREHSITAAPAGELIGFDIRDLERDILAWTGPGTAVDMDLAAVSFVDSMGIGFLLRLKGRIEARGGSMAIVNPRREIASIFFRYKLDGILCVRRAAPRPCQRMAC